MPTTKYWLFIMQGQFLIDKSLVIHEYDLKQVQARDMLIPASISDVIQ